MLPSEDGSSGFLILSRRRHLSQTQKLTLIPPLTLTHPTLLNPSPCSYTSKGATCNCTHLRDFSSYFVTTLAPSHPPIGQTEALTYPNVDTFLKPSS